ncbi:hypothetical protein [Paraburkholderia strydomiana]
MNNTPDIGSALNLLDTEALMERRDSIDPEVLVEMDEDIEFARETGQAQAADAMQAIRDAYANYPAKPHLVTP